MAGERDRSIWMLRQLFVLRATEVGLTEMAERFVDATYSRHYRYALGQDSIGGTKFLSIPVANRMADYEEYYRLSPDEYETFLADESAAVAFANECRRQAHDDRLIEQPGSDRGTSGEVAWSGPVPNPAR